MYKNVFLYETKDRKTRGNCNLLVKAKFHELKWSSPLRKLEILIKFCIFSVLAFLVSYYYSLKICTSFFKIILKWFIDKFSVTVNSILRRYHLSWIKQYMIHDVLWNESRHKGIYFPRNGGYSPAETTRFKIPQIKSFSIFFEYEILRTFSLWLSKVINPRRHRT